MIYATPVVTPWSNESIGDTVRGANLVLGDTSWSVANMAIMVPVSFGRAETIRKVAWANGAAIAGNVDVGLYSFDLVLATRLFSTGSVAQAGASTIQTATPAALPYTVTAGTTYYMVIASSNVGATFGGIGASPPQGAQNAAGVRQVAASFPLPATLAPTLIGTTGAGFLVMFGFSLYANLP